MSLRKIGNFVARCSALAVAGMAGYGGFLAIRSFMSDATLLHQAVPVAALCVALLYLLIELAVALGSKSANLRFFAALLSYVWILVFLNVIFDFPQRFKPEGVMPDWYGAFMSAAGGRNAIVVLALCAINAVSLFLDEMADFVQLVFKQMRQRALSSCLTLILVILGVGLAIAVMIVRRESEVLFGQSDFGYEFILGPPTASGTQLVFNTVFNIDQSPGNIPYQIYEDMLHVPQYRSKIRWAIPIMVGDTYQGRGDRRIVGTSPQMFGYRDDGTQIPENEESHPFEYRIDKKYELADSTETDKDGTAIKPRIFRPRRFEAVLGSEVAAKDGFHLYDDKLSEEQNFARHAVFQATHGMPAPNQKPDIHKPKWHVVGFLKPTHTASDRVLYVPVISLYAIEEHDIGMIAQKLIAAGYADPFHLPPDKAEDIFRSVGIDPDPLEEATRKRFRLPPKGGLAKPPATPPSPAPGGELLRDKPEPKPAEAEEDPDAYHLDDKGDIVPDLPKKAWEVSAILIKSRGSYAFTQLQFNFRVASKDFVAVNPASVMRDFFRTFFQPTTLVLLGISLLVTIVAAGSILVGIYNSVAARMREIAILRALGATRRRILALICAEAGLIGFLGAILGAVLGHALGALGSAIANAQLGQTINWIRVGWNEPWYANELLYLAMVVVVAILAGVVPALKAYRTSVATNLAGG